jgi:hypothetical protein
MSGGSVYLFEKAKLMREESETSATRIEEQINPRRVLVAMGICLFPLLLYALLLLSSVWVTTGEGEIP